jgi:hypothetical protein
VSNAFHYDITTVMMSFDNGTFQFHYHILGLLTYLKAIIDQNAVMWHRTVTISVMEWWGKKGMSLCESVPGDGMLVLGSAMCEVCPQ